MRAATPPPSAAPDPSPVSLDAVQRALGMQQAALGLLGLALITQIGLWSYMSLRFLERSADRAYPDGVALAINGTTLGLIAGTGLLSWALFALAAALVVTPGVAKVAGLARGAGALWAGELVLRLGGFALGRLGRALSVPAWVSGGVGIVQYAVEFAGTVLLFAVLLRLVQAGGERAAADRARGLRVAALVALAVRLLVGYAAYGLGPLLGKAPRVWWLVMAARAPLALLHFALLLVVLGMAGRALRAARLQPGGQPAPAADAPQDGASEASAYRNIALGALWALGGLTVTLVSFSKPGGLGGRVVVAYGAIVGGLVQLGVGMVQLSRRR